MSSEQGKSIRVKTKSKTHPLFQVGPDLGSDEFCGLIYVTM